MQRQREAAAAAAAALRHGTLYIRNVVETKHYAVTRLRAEPNAARASMEVNCICVCAIQ